MSPQIIAFYLPQYHPTQHNDEWWGTGFTEWTNVAKARPLFRGHYQPKIPADLGFYDLRLPEVRQAQADLAREAGVTGFCYYEYWFGNGHEELERPFREVVESGKPDFPFCLCWANESWYRKFWNNDGAVVSRKVLAEQTYPGLSDIDMHFQARLQAFRDPRYIRVGGKLLYLIYQPLDLPDTTLFINRWQELARQHGLPPFCFMGFTFNADKVGHDILSRRYDAVVSCRNNKDKSGHNLRWCLRKAKSILLHTPRTNDYRKMWPTLISSLERHDEHYIPVMMPNWDHTPRSGTNGDLFTHSTPEEFRKHCEDVLSAVAQKEHPLCFIKSWNEWGEGNYMEPDLKYGKGYIEALHDALSGLKLL
jgi:hypothetical protein